MDKNDGDQVINVNEIKSSNYKKVSTMSTEHRNYRVDLTFSTFAPPLLLYWVERNIN